MGERPLFWLVAGSRSGPYAAEQLRMLVADGRINHLDRFSYDGRTWLPADRFPELRTKSTAGTAAPAATPVVQPAARISPPPLVPLVPPPLPAEGAGSTATHRYPLAAAVAASLAIVSLAVIAWMVVGVISSLPGDRTVAHLPNTPPDPVSPPPPEPPSLPALEPTPHLEHMDAQDPESDETNFESQSVSDLDPLLEPETPTLDTADVAGAEPAIEAPAPPIDDAPIRALRDAPQKTPPRVPEESSPEPADVAVPDRVELPPPGPSDKVVARFIEYDIGMLRGLEATQAREQFATLGTESVGPLIRGLNQAATIGNSCPIMVLNSKLSRCLHSAEDPRLYVMAATNLCRGVPRTAPHYRTVAATRDACIRRLPTGHPLRQRQDRIDAMFAARDESAVDRALHSQDATERLAAVTVACSMGPRFGRELIAAIGDDDPAIRSEARQGLMTLSGNVDYGPQEPADEPDRRAAMASWTRWYDKQVHFSLPTQAWKASRATILASLKHDDEQTRVTAVLAIRYRRIFMVNELATMLSDPSTAVRREAHKALVDLANGKDFGPADFSKSETVEAAATLWRQWDNRRIRLLQNGNKTDAQILADMASPDDEKRLAAVSSAARRGLPSAQLFVERLSDSLPEIQQAARHGLVRLAGGEDFGPSEGVSAEERAEAVGRWKDWVAKSAGRDAARPDTAAPGRVAP